MLSESQEKIRAVFLIYVVVLSLLSLLNACFIVICYKNHLKLGIVFVRVWNRVFEFSPNFHLIFNCIWNLNFWKNLLECCDGPKKGYIFHLMKFQLI